MKLGRQRQKRSRERKGGKRNTFGIHLQRPVEDLSNGF